MGEAAESEKKKENEPPPLPPVSRLCTGDDACALRLVLFIFVLFRFTTAIELLLFGGFSLSFLPKTRRRRRSRLVRRFKVRRLRRHKKKGNESN
jgi:hypothetical protein